MKISIVVPCFNGEETVPLSSDEVEKFKGAYEFEYSFIDDGLKDGTLAAVKKLAPVYPYVRLASFSRNSGKEAVLYAGLQASTEDLAAVMDADLQDPPELPPEMTNRITTSGIGCVSTRHLTREGEPTIHSLFTKEFYQLINKINDTEMVDGTHGFRSMTRQMVDTILELIGYN